MKRTFLVLALALLCSSGCQTMGPKSGQSCGGPACGGPACGNQCEPCCEPCHVATMKHAPRPDGCCEGCCDSCGRGGNMENACPGGEGYCFDRYRGSDCGPGYPNGDYDCSPCNSPDWGCTGHKHPMGYRTARECYCNNQCPPGCYPC